MFTYLFCICYSLLFWNNFNLFYFPLKYKLVVTRLQYETLQKEHLHLDLNHYFIIISYKNLKLKIFKKKTYSQFIKIMQSKD